MSRAKENIKSEKTDIKIDGISVNNEKKTMYFRLATDPLTFILALIEFDISLKINKKKELKKLYLYKGVYLNSVDLS